MKKSEMVELIEKAIHDGDCRHTDYQDIDYTEIAAYILQSILKAGMVPPSVEFMMGSTKVRDNVWDKE